MNDLVDVLSVLLIAGAVATILLDRLAAYRERRAAREELDARTGADVDLKKRA